MTPAEFTALVLKTPSGRHSSSRTGQAAARFPCHPAAINPQFVGNRDGIFVGNHVGNRATLCEIQIKCKHEKSPIF